MNRMWVTILSLALLGTLNVQAGSAQKASKEKAAAKAAPQSAEIAASMGELRWGMGKDELIKKFILKTKAKYEPVIAKTKNAVEEDRLRAQQTQEIDAISKGYVEFDGRTTGWDMSYLKGEFAHNTNEGMLVVRDNNSQNFYFFIDGKLWKWYKAFDAEVFPADDFKAFQTSVERRFGTGKTVRSELKAGAGERQWIEWQDGKTRLRAIDETDFYGFYCLVFDQKATSAQLTKLRGGAEQSGPKRHALVESVTVEREGHIDSAPDIADRISGRVRERPSPSGAAPDGSASSASSKQRSPAAPSAASEPSPKPAKQSDDDPLSGLGL